MVDGKGNKTGGYVALRRNRRKFLRRQLLVLKVKGEDKKGVFFGYGKTISRDGMFITTVNPHKKGSEFEVAFKLPGVVKEVRCHCQVAWVREFNPKSGLEPGMGITFVDLDEDSRDKIDEWIKKGTVL